MLPFDTDNRTAGYRLDYLQVYNWGLYNDEVFTISPDLNSSLLIGGNASGKTTLIDALLTLFLSNPKYNLAGDAQKKHDRDITSYILGHFSEYTNNKGEILPESLRKKDDYSLILASFYNDGLKTNITIGQFFWFKTADSKRPERLYFISYNRKIKIEEDLFLNEISGVSVFKKRLERLKILSYGKKVSNREGLFTDKYSLYSDKFAELFGLRNKDKALNLFNQTVSLKNIGNLNNFIKNEMLDFVNIEPSLKKIKQAFDEAKLFSDEIEQTEKKVELIEPIVDKGKQYISLEQELTETKNSLHVMNSFFGTLKKALIDAEKKQKEKVKDELGKTFELNFNEDSGKLFDKKDEKKITDENIVLLKSDTGITTLSAELELIKTKLKPISDRNKEYERLIDGVLPMPIAENDFLKNIDTLKIKKAGSDKELLEKEKERDDFLIQEISPVKIKYETVKVDIDRLKKDKSSLIDENYEHVRKMICSTLGLDKNEIPFVCELVKVKNEATVWQSVIESLLHDFGLTILVEEKHYNKVCEFIYENNFENVKLNFHRIPKNIEQSDTSNKDIELLNRLEIKPNCKDILKEWILKILLSEFNLTFCDNLNSFHNNVSALTKNGIIKRNGIFHIKDYNILSNSSNYILGWDNTDKINELSRLEDELLHELQAKESDENKLTDQIKLLKDFVFKASDLLKFTTFLEIDYKSIEKEIESLEERLITLEKNEELNSLNQKSMLLQNEIAVLVPCTINLFLYSAIYSIK